MPSAAPMETVSEPVVAPPTAGAAGVAGNVHTEPDAAAVASPAPLRDWPAKAYSVSGASPAEVHAVLPCCQPELVPAVVFSKYRPDMPSARFAGVLEANTLTAEAVTFAKVRPATGSINVHAARLAVFALSPMMFDADTWNAYSLFTARPLCCHHTVFPTVVVCRVAGGPAPGSSYTLKPSSLPELSAHVQVIVSSPTAVVPGSDGADGAVMTRVKPVVFEAVP